MKIDRETALKHLARGFVVLHDGREIRLGARLPEGVNEFTAARNDDGTHTRAGMEHTIKRGGSVLIGDKRITKAEDLPPDGTQLEPSRMPRVPREAPKQPAPEKKE
jgi:hypothetical protein